MTRAQVGSFEHASFGYYLRLQCVEPDCLNDVEWLVNQHKCSEHFFCADHFLSFFEKADDLIKAGSVECRHCNGSFTSLQDLIRYREI